MASPSSPAPVPAPAETSPAPALAAASAPAAQESSASNPTPQPAAVGGSATPSTSLYVGELDPTVSEAMLFEIFNMVGPVASIRVCRDAVTRRSLGYAYINYLNPTDAERALEQLNYSLIKNRACRIMFSQRDPALRKTGQGNIFIKNLDEAIDNKALHDTFAAFGNVLSCKVATDESGASRGYGFVHYDTAEAADAAIKHVNGMLLNDKKVFVGHHVSKKERQSKLEEAKANFTNIYLKNLPESMDTDALRVLCEKYGPVTSAVVQMNEEGGSRGFGFVNYESHEHARAAVEALHESEQEGQKLFVSRAQKKHEREEELRRSYEAAKLEKLSKYAGVNLYIKNLPDDYDDDKLRSEFEPFGTITSAKIMRDDKTNLSRGFGFVCFSQPEEATKAVTEMNGKMVGNKPIYVALAQRREQRRAQLESLSIQRNQIRLQQQAAAGMAPYPGAYPGAPPPMYYPGGYPPAPGAPPGQRGPSGVMYPPSGQLLGRPRYAPGPGQGQAPPVGAPLAAPYPGAPAGPPNGAIPPYGAVPPAGYRGPPGSRPPRGPPGPSGAAGAAAPRGAAAPNGSPAPAAVPRGAPGPAGGVPPASRAPYRLNPGVRNSGSGAGQPGQQRQQQEAGAAPAEPALTAAALANAPPTEQKQMLGEAIYPKIFLTQPELAGKVTGMLLEMPVDELLHLLEDDEALNAKVEEALVVLREYSGAPEA